MGKIVAFTGVAAAAVVCFYCGSYGAVWRDIAAQVADRAPTFALAGGLFTIAIAVLIRD